MTIRFILRNAYSEKDPDITAQLQELYTQCPTLFKQVLSRANRNELADMADADANADDIEKAFVMSENNTHVQTVMINRVDRKELMQTTHPIQGNNLLPMKNRQIFPLFISKLRAAYYRDYGYPISHPTGYENSDKIAWSHKLGFNDK